MRGHVEIVGIAVCSRYTDELAGRAIRPAMVGTIESTCVAAFLPAKNGPAVPTGIEKYVNVAMLIAGGNHRLQADHGGFEVAGLRQFALVSNVDPCLVEDIVQF